MGQAQEERGGGAKHSATHLVVESLAKRTLPNLAGSFESKDEAPRCLVAGRGAASLAGAARELSLEQITFVDDARDLGRCSRVVAVDALAFAGEQCAKRAMEIIDDDGVNT